MKRSRVVHLVFLGSALSACSHKECIDSSNTVVDDRYCRTTSTGAGYRWYSSGGFRSDPAGATVNPASGTVRGVFGSAGEAAHGSGGGAGE